MNVKSLALFGLLCGHVATTTAYPGKYLVNSSKNALNSLYNTFLDVETDLKITGLASVLFSIACFHLYNKMTSEKNDLVQSIENYDEIKEYLDNRVEALNRYSSPRIGWHQNWDYIYMNSGLPAEIIKKISSLDSKAAFLFIMGIAAPLITFGAMLKNMGFLHQYNNVQSHPNRQLDLEKALYQRIKPAQTITIRI